LTDSPARKRAWGKRGKVRKPNFAVGPPTTNHMGKKRKERGGGGPRNQGASIRNQRPIGCKKTDQGEERVSQTEVREGRCGGEKGRTTSAESTSKKWGMRVKLDNVGWWLTRDFSLNKKRGEKVWNENCQI